VDSARAEMQDSVMESEVDPIARAARDVRSVRLLAEQVLGSAVEARRWLATPSLGLGRKVPRDLLTTPDGRRLVVTLLYRIDTGVYC
jgi:putative toxin-antitoxin system antitoxin component (TIGR02293 family)